MLTPALPNFIINQIRLEVDYMAAPSSRYIFGTIPWYSVLIVCGAALAILLAVREEKRAGLPKDTVIDLALWVLPLGILGARLYYVIFSWSQYRDHPLSVLFIWEGGLAIYGGLIAGLLTVVFFCRARKLSILRVCDILVPGVVLAQAIGRWGNYFNQEAFGLPLTNPAFCFFPLGVLIPENGAMVWHMATFFYESSLDFLIFLFLILFRRTLQRRSGDVFFAYLFLYGAARLIVENFRMDSLYTVSGIRVSQLLSALFCGAIWLCCFRRLLAELKPKKPSLSVLFLCIPALVAEILLILFCVNSSSLPLSGVRSQLVFLSCCSLVLIGTLVPVYLQTRKPEVSYADN